MKMVQKGSTEALVKRPEFNLEPLVEGYGKLPAYRIRRAARKFAEGHLRTDLRIIPLEQGERLQFGGLTGLDISYQGISGGKSVFQNRDGVRIENQLMRASRGLRYDIFVGAYWTRESVKAAFPRSTANFDAISRVQALEMLVYDKRTGTAVHSWLSLGANKEKVWGEGKSGAPTEKELPKIRTERLPDLPKATHKSMAPSLMPALEPATKKSLSLPLATTLVVEAARKYISLAPTEGPQVVLSYSQKMVIGGKEVEFGREGGNVVVSFSRSGHSERKDVNPGDLTLKARELADGYRVAFAGFPLEDNSKGQVCDYVLVATVVSPSNELHALFVLGARG